MWRKRGMHFSPSELNCLICFSAFPQSCGLAHLPWWSSHLPTHSHHLRPGHHTAFPLTAFFSSTSLPRQQSCGWPSNTPYPDSSFLSLRVISATHIHGQSRELVMGWTALTPMPCSLPIDDTNHRAWGVNDAVNSQMAEPWLSLYWVNLLRAYREDGVEILELVQDIVLKYMVFW